MAVGVGAPPLIWVFDSRERERAVIRQLLMALLIGLGWSAAEARAVDHSWWLTAEFAPAGESIEGLSLAALDPSWVAASALREDMFPSEARKKGESVAEHGAHLALAADLDGDRQEEKALVGVYRDKAGSLGRFLLVLARDQRGRLQKKALFAEPGVPGFSALLWREGTLAWVFCMECDSKCVVAYKRRALALECESCCKE